MVKIINENHASEKMEGKMTKTKKILFVLPLMILLVLTAILFVGCNHDNKEVINVSNLTELNEAIQTTDDDHIIKLTKDIEMEMDGSKVLPVLIYSNEKDLDVEIDLNGHNIYTYVRVQSKDNDVETTKEVDLTIKNSKKGGGLIGFEDNEFYYALAVLANNKCEIELENITFKAQYGGLYTNGSYNGETVIEAENCKFISTHTNTITDAKDGGVGAYLASKNFTYNFEDCYFEGYTAYHTKHGTHNLENCTMKATGTVDYEPAFYGNGGSATASALMIESSNDFAPAANEKTLIVNVKGGRYSSIANYAIQEASTSQSGEDTDEVCYAKVTITGNPVLDGEGTKTIISENNLID